MELIHKVVVDQTWIKIPIMLLIRNHNPYRRRILGLKSLSLSDRNIKKGAGCDFDPTRRQVRGLGFIRVQEAYQSRR
jgi:hypothetical protein